jgi:hypothetical protein
VLPTAKTGFLSVGAFGISRDDAARSFVYWTVEAAPPGANLVDFAFVNYTTLGYGDVLPTQDWRLLGPITAMNGVLLFGWSTAIIFEALRRALSRAGISGNL